MKLAGRVWPGVVTGFVATGAIVTTSRVHIVSLAIIAATVAVGLAITERLADIQRDHIALLEEELADVRRCLATAIEDRSKPGRRTT